MTSSSPISELTTLHLKPGIDIHKADSQAWSEILKTISSQPGFLSLTWGSKIEDPTIIILCINWKSYKDHETFTTASFYTSFLETVSALFTTVEIHHFTPPQSLLSKVPVVETVTVFLATPEFYGSNLTKFANAVRSSSTTGLKGVEIGEVVEELAKEEGGEAGRACKLFIGWESVEDHMAFRETAVFKENIGLLREGNGGIEMKM
ncbi:hypothetical protein M7I_0298 [Glarea lozoyensis 74030]|uniref:Dimeric alpha+beta barrel n=1 Tax=Glarea lozoyensis (strain ATCC 74030 / MF5533) TaxID=1104152 RepID=H0ED00_GLAL7|nr:hypothetical protein M7I_0298 [Glarea lozoyensis 74030]